MSTPKILAFAGSTREGSFNKKLAKIAAEGAKSAGADVTFIDLRDYPLPLYDQDLEDREGFPENARKLKDLFIESDGFLIASPEYNSSLSGVLKNAIDWVSRPQGDEPMLFPFRGKAAAIMSASPGGLGGMRGLIHLRSILGNIGMLVLPDQKAISGAGSAFDDSDRLKDPQKQEAIEQLGVKLAQTLSKLKA